MHATGVSDILAKGRTKSGRIEPPAEGRLEGSSSPSKNHAMEGVFLFANGEIMSTGGRREEEEIEGMLGEWPASGSGIWKSTLFCLRSEV